MLQVEFTPSPRILKGLDEIASYLRVSRRTAWRWVQNYALPAMKSPAGTHMTSTALIDLWILACWNTQQGRRVSEEDSSW